MKPSLSVPSPFGCSHDGCTKGVEEWIGRMEPYLLIVVFYTVFRGFHTSAECRPVHIFQSQAIRHHLGKSRFLPRYLQALQHFTVTFQASRLIGTDVTITVQPLFAHTRHHSLQFRHLMESHGIEMPGSTVGIHQTADIQQKTGSSPTLILQTIPPLSAGIACFATGCAVKCQGMPLIGNTETHIPAVARVLEQSKYGTVTGFQTVSGRSAIECTGITVVAILANHHIIFRNILQFTYRSALIIIIGSRFDKITHTFLCL